MSTVQQALDKADALLRNPAVGSITAAKHLDLVQTVIGAINNPQPVPPEQFASWPSIPIITTGSSGGLSLPVLNNAVGTVNYSLNGLPANGLNFTPDNRGLMWTGDLLVGNYPLEYIATDTGNSQTFMHTFTIHVRAAPLADIIVSFGYGDATASADASFGTVAGQTSFNIAFPQVPETTPLDGTHFYWVIWTDPNFTPRQMINSLGINQYPADWELTNGNRALKSKAGIIRRAGPVNYTLIGTRS